MRLLISILQQRKQTRRLHIPFLQIFSRINNGGLHKKANHLSVVCFFCFTAALWRGILPAVQSKELLMKQFFPVIFFTKKCLNYLIF